MKLADLKVGESYYADSSTNWQDYNHGRKVTVTSLERFSRPHRWSNDRQIHPSPNGLLIPIELDSFGSTYVNPREIRGLWATIKPQQEAKAQAKAKAHDLADQAARAYSERGRAALAILGLEPRMTSRTGNLSVTVEELERVIAVVRAYEN